MPEKRLSVLEYDYDIKSMTSFFITNSGLLNRKTVFENQGKPFIFSTAKRRRSCLICIYRRN